MRVLSSRLSSLKPKPKREDPHAKKADDLAEITKSTIDASSLIRGMWLSFILFGVYYIITIGAVTHDDLFLERPTRLPVLGTELPLNAFFSTAPFIFVIYHFYMLLQLALLAGKIAHFNKVLREQVPDEAVRRKLRAQLPPHIFLQMLAGVKDEREGLKGMFLRAVAWISVVIMPILALLLTQLQFLPYHNEQITWLHRIALVIDLVLIVLIWSAVVGRSAEIGLTARRVIVSAIPFGLLATFSLAIAVFPGEKAYDKLRIGANVVSIPIENPDAFERNKKPILHVSLTTYLFESDVNEVTSRRARFFSNTLVLPDRIFVTDKMLEDKKNGEPTLSLRGRHFKNAIFSRSDLRQADFTGAMLDGAKFIGAKLDRVKMGCAETGKDRSTDDSTLAWPKHGCVSLQGANLSSAQMQGANLKKALMQGTNFDSAQIHGADFSEAQMQEVNFSKTQIQKANFFFSELGGAYFIDVEAQEVNFSMSWMQGANLSKAKLQGANLSNAKLQGANLTGVWLQGAYLGWAEMQGTNLIRAQIQSAILNRSKLQGASLYSARAQGANLIDVEIQGALIEEFAIWRTSGFNLSLKYATGFIVNKKTHAYLVYDKKTESFDDFIKSNNSFHIDNQSEFLKRLSILDPNKDDPEDMIPLQVWQEGTKTTPDDPARVNFLSNLACSDFSAPYVARGMVSNGVITSTGKGAITILTRMKAGKKQPDQCPGTRGFTEEDWQRVDAMLKEATEKPAP